MAGPNGVLRSKNNTCCGLLGSALLGLICTQYSRQLAVCPLAVSVHDEPGVTTGTPAIACCTVSGLGPSVGLQVSGLGGGADGGLHPQPATSRARDNIVAISSRGTDMSLNWEPTMQTITALDPPASLTRVTDTGRPPLRVGVVQHHWHDDAQRLCDELTDAIGQAAELGAKVVFLSELTLSRYPADVPSGENPGRTAEDLHTGPTFTFAAKAAARHGVLVHASLYERAEAGDGLGFNTAILVSPDSGLLARTRKLHIPVTAGYYEDTYFRGGPAANPYPVHTPAAAGRRPDRHADVLGRMVPGGGADVFAWAAPRFWSIPPRSAPNPTTRISTVNRCGSR